MIEIFLITLISIKIIYSFIAQPFLVQGASMQPAFYGGDYLLIDEVTYRFREPERYEVIVFRNPRNHEEFYIKRIVGLPGEGVVIKGDKVFINDKSLAEEYLPQSFRYQGEYNLKLKTDEYFVLGDNRPWSLDSRSWGPLKKNQIIGLVRLRFWPVGKVEVFADAKAYY